MISVQIRKGFTYLFPRNTSFLREPHFSASLAQHFFSTSTKKEGKQKVSGNSESVVSFLKEIGFSDAQLESVFKRRAHLRYANLEKTIKPKIKVFHDFGFSYPETAEIIVREPKILNSSVSRLAPSLSLLNEISGSHDELVKLLKKSVGLLRCDKNGFREPNIKLLKGRGVPMEHISWIVRSYTKSLIPPETMKSHLDKLESLGIDPNSKLYMKAFMVVSSMSNKAWEQKMQTLRDLGFTESEISDMFKRDIRLFRISAEKIKNVTEFLLATKKYSKASILTYPNVFCFNVEKRVKPRLEALEILQENNMIWRWPCLGDVLIFTSKRFHDRFVAPYTKYLPKEVAKNLINAIAAS